MSISLERMSREELAEQVEADVNDIAEVIIARWPTLKIEQAIHSRLIGPVNRVIEYRAKIRKLDNMRRVLEKAQPGSRIKTCFGYATIEDPQEKSMLYRQMGWLWVRWDEKPPMEYNMGQNPGLIRSAECELV